jgi:hypothetical protein
LVCIYFANGVRRRAICCARKPIAAQAGKVRKIKHIDEVRPRKDHRGVDLISDALPFGRLLYGEPNAISNAIGYAKFRSRSHGAVIRVYDDAAM